VADTILDIAELDVIYLSYDEPQCEEFWADLLNKVPWAKRVHGVDGSDNAHRAAGEMSETERFILVDGDQFKGWNGIPFQTITGGDNKYTAIAAASILAKVERDKYIEELCNEYPHLDERYDLLSNKGYGTKAHMDGIKEHGITAWHRRTYGICKNYTVSDK